MGIIVIIIIAIGLVAGGHALIDGRLPINFFTGIVGVFIAGVLVMIGGMFGRDHNKDRDMNGEIEGRLQDYTDRLYQLHWMSKSGANVDAQIADLERQEREFKNSIEYGKVTDGAENYYSYKDGKK